LGKMMSESVESVKSARERTQRLTAEFIRDVKAPRGAWFADGESDRDRGALYLRVTPNGAKTFYFRYAVGGRRRGVLRIGPAGSGGMDLKTAREKRDELRRRRMKEGRDVGAVLRRERNAALAAEEEARLAKDKTLGSLIGHYVGHLERRGAAGWKNVRNLLRRNVTDAHSALARRPANSIEPADVVKITRKLVEQGKARTAAMVRSYLAAAYQMALHAETDATAPAAMIGFRLTGNPAQATKPIRLAVRDRALTADELHHVLAAIEAMPDAPPRRLGKEADPSLCVNTIKAALRLGLLLGGQRPVQLLRATVRDVDLAAGTIALLDPKGRRQTPRRHVLPLQGEAKDVVARLVRRSEKLSCEHLFTLTGKRALGVIQVSHAVGRIAAKLTTLKKCAKFTLADLRRTCETHLAGLGISRDVRAQLLSHGLGGVQDRHYDRHSYMKEKQAALAAWEKRLMQIAAGEPAPDNVVRMPARAAA
jgi:integrase